jgi:AcrR family transcriptional regulator
MYRMSGSVKRRRYRSVVRAEQAQRTRERIVAAARALFLERGFAGTTITSVAEAAEVAPETVYASFRGKAGLLEAVVLAAVLRDDEPDEPVQRRWFQGVLELPDTRARLAALARHAAATTALTSPIYAVVRAAGLEDLDDRLRDYRFGGQAKLVEKIVDGPDAAATFSALAGPELHHVLTVGRGWSQERYTAWLERTVVAALAPD